MIREYNRQAREEMDSVRDFLVLHYHATQRSGQPFWDYCRTMPIPDTLAYKLDLFRSSGRYPELGYDLFKLTSWVAVMIGQGIDPQGFDPMVDSVAPRDADRILSGMRAVIAQTAQQMPSHQQFIDRHCRAAESPDLSFLGRPQSSRRQQGRLF